MAKNKKAKPKKTKDKTDDDKPASAGPGLVSQLIIAVALGGASFGTVMFLPDRSPKPVHVDAGHEAPKDPVKEIIPGPDDVYFVSLDELTLSLINIDRILRIGITLEVLQGSDLDIGPHDPALKDAFTSYLRSLRIEQLQDPTFMVRMRNHLLHRAQLVYDSDAIYSVMITDFLVR